MNKVFNILRDILLKHITGNLGKVVVKNNEIICYVDNLEIAKRYCNKDLMYKVSFCNSKKIKSKILDKLNINKPIHYILKGIRFNNKVLINADKDTKISFQSCKFHKQICIKGADKVYFIENKYYDRYPAYAYEDKFLIIRANSILFMNENFVNSIRNIDTQFGMNIIANELNIIHSTFDIKDTKESSIIIADEIGIINSQVSCQSIDFICNNIVLAHSKIIAKTNITIDEKNNNNNNFTETIESPVITYNGVKKEFVSDEDIAKRYFRTKLIKVLKEVKNNCINEINKKSGEERKQLNEAPISKIKR